MKPIAVYKKDTGEIIRTTSVPEGVDVSGLVGLDASGLVLDPNLDMLDVTPEVSGETHWVHPVSKLLQTYSLTVLQRKNQRKNTNHRWAPALEVWEDFRDMNEKKKDLRSAVITKARTVITDGVVRGSHRWAVDDEVVLQIQSFIEELRDGEPFPGSFSWPNYEELLITLSQAQFVSLVKSLRKWRRDVKTHLEQLKAQIAAAANEVELGLIDIEAGWPS